MAAERKGKKLRRCAKHANYYKLQPGVTDRNKARRLRRHIRSNPFDKAAQERYAVNMGDPKGIGLNAHGKRKLFRTQRKLK